MKFFLCDDDKGVHEVYAKKLAALCQKHGVDFQFVAYTSGEQMLFDYEEQDGFNGVIFLDINMPGLNGIAVAKQLQDYGSKGEIIFLTVSQKHFLMAFDVGAFNYIVKDTTTDARFEEIFLKAVSASLDKEQEYILFTSGGEHRSILIKSIYYFEVVKRIITVHYGKGEFEFFSSIGKVENQLYGRGFIRAHRSYLVNLAQVETMTYTELFLRNGDVIPIGRKYYPDVKAAFNEFYAAFTQ